MQIYDHRGSLQFSLYRILENEVNGYNTQIVREPFELEFSRHEIRYFLSYFYDYLIGYFQSMRRMYPSLSFLKKVDSNLILYSYKDDNYFEEQYDSKSRYESAIKDFESVELNVWKPQTINTILQSIISEIVEK